jgi:hypothetical protein
MPDGKAADDKGFIQGLIERWFPPAAAGATIQKKLPGPKPVPGVGPDGRVTPEEQARRNAEREKQRDALIKQRAVDGALQKKGS